MARSSGKGAKGANGKGHDTGDGGTPPARSEATVSLSNSAERAKIIQECAQAMRGIHSQRKDLNEEAGEIRERIKNLGMPVKAWEATLRVVDMDDEAARDAFMDGMRESFQALKPGQSVDFLDHMPKQAAAPSLRTQSGKEARTAGRQAGTTGKNSTTNPHPEGTENHAEWHGGWVEGQEEIGSELGAVQGNGSAAQAAVAEAAG